MFRFLLILLGFAAFAFLAIWVAALGAAAIGAIVGWRRLRQRIAVARFRRVRSDPADPLDAAWSKVAEQADWAASRVATARTSCVRLIAIADAQPLATEAVDWANVIRRRVPDLIDACMAECEHATPAERRLNLEDLVESLEKIGAEADRRRDRFRSAGAGPFAVQRTYVDQRTRPDPLN